MASPRFSSPPLSYGGTNPISLSRVASMSSDPNSFRYSRTQTSGSGDGFSEIVSFEGAGDPRSRYYDQLHELAVAAGVPLALPKPLLSVLSLRAVAQNPSDRTGAEEYLMSMRPKKFLVGKSSKGFTSDEILLGLDKAVKANTALPIIEALLQLAETAGNTASSPTTAFTSNKKGHAIPTVDYIFGQTVAPRSVPMSRLFLGRVSQHARDSALAGALSNPNRSVEMIKALLEWGANPEICRSQILELLSSPNSEDLIELLFLSPSITDTEFFSQALVQSCQSLRNSSILLHRGADGNANHGEALKMAVSKQRYDTALAIALLSKRPLSARILDNAAGLIGSWSRDLQLPWLKLLVYAGACGQRTSKAVTPFVMARESEITSILVESHAFTHGSFPTQLLFQAAVEARQGSMALNIVRSSKKRSFSDYASTGVHIQLVQSYVSQLEEALEIISELLSMGITGDCTSQMLLKCCEAEQIQSPEIMALIELLVQNGGAKASYAEGKSIFLAIDDGNPLVVSVLMSTRPTKKILSAAVEYANTSLADQNPAKLEICTILVQSGAAGQGVDQQLVLAIDRTPQALGKVKTLLHAASLDYSDGAALMKAIQLQRHDILETCLGAKVPHSSLPSIWKQTRNLFAIAGSTPYNLQYMQAVFGTLRGASKDSTPLNDLLQDASQCRSKELSLPLCTQFIRWGASPNHALGAPLIACIRRSDTQTLDILLSHDPTKASLKYAFEEALLLRAADRYEIVKLIIKAGLEKSCLDAALPRILEEEKYDSPIVHLIVGNGARLHSSWGEHLIPSALHLDYQMVETLMPKGADDDIVLLPLKTVLSSRSDWLAPDGASLPMVKLLLARAKPGTWGDRSFIMQTKTLNQHAANLFAGHLTSKQVFSDALRELLSQDEANLSPKKLSMASYLLSQGAVGDVIDATFLQAVRVLNQEWVTTLNPYLQNPATKLSAFEAIANKNQSNASLNGRRLAIRQFLLAQGVRGRAVDELFLTCAESIDLRGLNEHISFVTSTETLSQALDCLSKNTAFATTNDGLAAVKLLIANGATGTSILNAARAAAQAHSQHGVELIMKSSNNMAACKTAFQGLMDDKSPLSSPESRSVLRSLVSRGLDGEDMNTVVRQAATTYDKDLIKEVTSTNNGPNVDELALTVVASTGKRWLSASGFSFVQFLLNRGARSPAIQEMITTATKSLHLPALRILLEACDDKTHAATIAFTGLASDEEGLLSVEGRSILEFLLQEGAKGSSVESAAANAASTSNYDVLDIFLRSPVAASVIPPAFRAVARDKSRHLSSEQLSIASILVKHGVSTEVLAIAAVEAVKLLDLEALKVLSRSPRFGGVTEDTLRALLLDEGLWRSLDGLRIMQFLFETGVGVKSAEAAAAKASAALDIDVLRAVLDSNPNSEPEIVEAAFTSMTGLEERWLCPEGLRIADLLLQRGPSQVSLQKAFLQACRHLHYDAMQLLYPHITDPSVFNTALSKATSADADWFSELHLVEKLLDAGVEGEVVEAALVKAARALNYSCVELLASKLDRPEAFAKAFSAALTNQNWRESLDIIELLLRYGAYGEAVDEGYISAAGHLDYQALTLISDCIDKQDVNCRAFTAAAANVSWLLPGHIGLLEYLYDRGLNSDIVKPALVSAAAALNLPIVDLLATDATAKMASVAFEAATADGQEWTSPDGTAIIGILANKGAQGDRVDQVLIESAQQSRLDLVEALHGNVDKSNHQCFSHAFDAVVLTSDSWPSSPEALDILQILISKGFDPESAPSSLVYAAQDGNLQAVELLSQVVDDPTVYAEALNTFVQSGTLWLQDESHQLVQLLLSRGSANDGLHSSLLDAVEGAIAGQAAVDLVELLLQSGADVNYGNGVALQLAVQYGVVDLASRLPRHGANETTLYMGLKKALTSDHSEDTVLELFITILDASEGVAPAVNHDSDLGSPLIFYSLMYYPQSTNIARQICELGAEADATIDWQVYVDESNPPPEDSIQPLAFALLNNASDEVIEDVLLAYGADIEHVPRQSQISPLVLAAKVDRPTILATLIDRGARVVQKDYFDRTPLFYAGRNGSVPALTSLLKKKPPFNDGSLHEAARELHSEAISTLVAAGHDVNFPSLKHGGRNPLCELCFNCRGSEDPVGLQETLSELMARKASPLRKCRERTALFYALENLDPMPVVSKLIEVCLWKDLNDPINVFEEGNYSYSATMYLKKGIYRQPESTAHNLLELLQSCSAQDRYYAKERMQQPPDAVGMPQRIADLDRKKWIRSNRLEEENEDHERRLRREMEEMSQRDQLTTQRHLLTMEHREDLASQTINHNADNHFQGMQFRSMEHQQSMRYKDDHLDHRLDEFAATHRLRHKLEQQNRDAQLQYDSQTSGQKLGFIGQEQDLRLGGAQAQQQLKLGGITRENELRNEQERAALQFREERGALESSEMDARLRHMQALNQDKVLTQDRIEEGARMSQQRKIALDAQDRTAQLEFHEATDDRKLRTEGAMNQFRRANNDDNIRTKSAITNISEADRQNQLHFAENQGRIQNATLQERSRIEYDSGIGKNRLLQDKGRIENAALYHRGRIENQTLDQKHRLIQDNRSNELQHTAQMGQQRVQNEYELGQTKVFNERNMGEAKVINERNMGQQRIQNEAGMGQIKYKNEIAMGDARASSEQKVGTVKNQMNRQRLIDNFRASQAQAQLKAANQQRRLR